MRIYTSSWFTRLPLNMLWVGISHETPRRQLPGYRCPPELGPVPWFKSVNPAEYHRDSMAKLAAAQERIAALLTNQRMASPAPVRRGWWRWGRA